MPPRTAYLILPASTLDRILAEAASAKVSPLWMLAALAVELQFGDAESLGGRPQS